MSASDLHVGVAIDGTGITVPVARLIGEIARTTAKHITVECVAVGTSGASTAIIIFVVGGEWSYIVPVGTLC